MALALEVIEVEQTFRVGFWLKPVKVLYQVSLQVAEKSIFGFLGANGAGKTTLIHLITGLRKPASGSVLVFGREAHTVAAKSRIGYLPERPYFHEGLTGEGMLKYYGALSGLSRTKIQARIPKVLAVVGMSHAKNTELKKYSKGMLQRIGIAQAMIHDPELLVLDEPMSGLDPIGRKEIRELILELSSEGRTIFFSSHVIPDVEAICDQVGLLQKGKLAGCGPIGNFLATGPVRTEVAFTGLGMEKWSQWPEFLTVQKMRDGMKGIVEGQQSVDKVLAKLMKEKGTVLWVTPIRPSLESFFEEKTVEQEKKFKNSFSK